MESSVVRNGSLDWLNYKNVRSPPGNIVSISF